jgi:hypothetical protein
VAQAKAYLANPSAGTLQLLQTQVTTFQQQVNAALLQAAKIVNPTSQQDALAAIQGVGTIVNAILSLVASISSKAAVTRMAAQSGVKLSMVQPYWDGSLAAEIVAAHYNEPVALARAEISHSVQEEINAGF